MLGKQRTGRSEQLRLFIRRPAISAEEYSAERAARLTPPRVARENPSSRTDASPLAPAGVELLSKEDYFELAKNISSSTCLLSCARERISNSLETEPLSFSLSLFPLSFSAFPFGSPILSRISIHRDPRVDTQSCPGCIECLRHSHACAFTCADVARVTRSARRARART